MDPVLRYFRDKGVVRQVAVSVTSTAVQALQADPLRYATSIWNDGTIDLTVTFGDVSTQATGTMHIPAGSGPVFLTEDLIGELIRLPMRVVSATAGPTSITLYTVSYTPDRYHKMERYVYGCLTVYGAL